MAVSHTCYSGHGNKEDHGRALADLTNLTEASGGRARHGEGNGRERKDEKMKEKTYWGLLGEHFKSLQQGIKLESHKPETYN